MLLVESSSCWLSPQPIPPAKGYVPIVPVPHQTECPVSQGPLPSWSNMSELAQHLYSPSGGFPYLQMDIPSQLGWSCSSLLIQESESESLLISPRG
jgi:hypothetical protein